MIKVSAANVLGYALVLNGLRKLAVDPPMGSIQGDDILGPHYRAGGKPVVPPAAEAAAAPAQLSRMQQAKAQVGRGAEWVKNNKGRSAAIGVGVPAVALTAYLASRAGGDESVEPAATFNPSGVPSVPAPPAPEAGPLLGKYSPTGGNIGDAAVGVGGVAAIAGLYALLRQSKKREPQLALA